MYIIILWGLKQSLKSLITETTQIIFASSLSLVLSWHSMLTEQLVIPRKIKIFIHLPLPFPLTHLPLLVASVHIRNFMCSVVNRLVHWWCMGVICGQVETGNKGRAESRIKCGNKPREVRFEAAPGNPHLLRTQGTVMKMCFWWKQMKSIKDDKHFNCFHF